VRRCTVSAVFNTFLLLSACSGADWPQWRGPNRDGTVVGVTLPQAWATTLKQVWETNVGQGLSSPVVVDDRIYVHSRREPDEMVSCLDLADGKTIWTGRYPAPWEIQPGAGNDKGPHSTPTVQGDGVFTLGVSGVLTRWDARTGDVKWRRSPPAGARGAVPQYGAALSPLVSDGLVFAHGAVEHQTALAAFDAATGEMKWAWTNSVPSYASPILVEFAGQRQLVVLSESKLAAFSPADGKVLWHRNLRPRNSYENIITPVQFKDLLIYAQTGYPEIIAVRVVRNGDAFRLEEVWTNREHRLSECTPIVVGELLMGLSSGKVGHLFCLDAATGRTLWEHGSGLQSEVPPVNAGGVVVVVTKGILITLLRPNPERYEPVAEWKGPVNAIHVGPVFLGDRILVWDSRALRLFRLAK
jgi:outer membrane protein assembly factor BamB